MAEKSVNADPIPGEPYYPDSSFSFDYPPERPVSCKNCAWTGFWRETQSTELSSLGYWIQVCPKCTEKLALLQGWIPEEVIAEAERGNPNATPLLAQAQKALESRVAYESRLVKDPTGFPDVPQGKKQVFIWDLEDYAPGESGDRFGWNVIRLAGTGLEICREPASYEVPERFQAIKVLLKERYGSRFGSLIPTSRSWMYLFGDATFSVSACGVTRSATSEEAPWAE